MYSRFEDDCPSGYLAMARRECGSQRPLVHKFSPVHKQASPRGHLNINKAIMMTACIKWLCKKQMTVVFWCGLA